MRLFGQDGKGQKRDVWDQPLLFQRDTMRYRLNAPIFLTFLLTSALIIPAIAFPSFNNQDGKKNLFSPEQILTFSKKVEQTLAAKGVRVAILARKGRPQSALPEGMHFTHTAFVVYSESPASDGRRVPDYTVYNDYQQDDNPARSHLVNDFPADFFAEVAELEAGIIIPSAALQKRLLAVIASPTYKALHNPHYSIIANPYTLGKQNCTEFVLDVINSALYQTDDINIIKAHEQIDFVAQEVHVSSFKLLLGVLFNAEVSILDQPGPPVTATFETIGRYLEKQDKGTEILTVTPNN
jgi:hypothetical protein